MESSRQRVLDATIELTRELGETPSLRTIGERAGVALGTISAHFPSRDDLLVEVERRELERLDEQLGDATDVDPDAALRALGTVGRADPGLTSLLLDYDRAHLLPPERLSRVMTGESDGPRAQMILDDVAGAAGYMRVKNVEATDDQMRRIRDVLAASARSEIVDEQEPAGRTDLVEQLRRRLDRPSKLLSGLTIDRATFDAALDVLGDGQPLTARRIARRLGSGMSRMYDRHTMGDLRLAVDELMFETVLAQVSTIDELLEAGQRMVDGAARFPALFDHVVKVTQTEPSVIERLLDDVVAKERAAGRLRDPELRDDQYRAIMVGPIARRWHGRHVVPEAWIDIADHLARLRVILTERPS